MPNVQSKTKKEKAKTRKVKKDEIALSRKRETDYHKGVQKEEGVRAQKLSELSSLRELRAASRERRKAQQELARERIKPFTSPFKSLGRAFTPKKMTSEDIRRQTEKLKAERERLEAQKELNILKRQVRSTHSNPFSGMSRAIGKMSAKMPSDASLQNYVFGTPPQGTARPKQSSRPAAQPAPKKFGMSDIVGDFKDIL